jgi:hypothetical protein
MIHWIDSLPQMNCSAVKATLAAHKKPKPQKQKPLLQAMRQKQKQKPNPRLKQSQTKNAKIQAQKQVLSPSANLPNTATQIFSAN